MNRSHMYKSGGGPNRKDGRHDWCKECGKTINQNYGETDTKNCVWCRNGYDGSGL